MQAIDQLWNAARRLAYSSPLKIAFTIACFVACSLGAPMLRAQPFSAGDIPPELLPWVPWALDGLGDEICPSIADKHVCVWPGELELDLAKGTGTFSERLDTDRETIVPLPGSNEHWPEDVEADGKALVVLASEELPVAMVGRGHHEIRGLFNVGDHPLLPSAGQ